MLYLAVFGDIMFIYCEKAAHPGLSAATLFTQAWERPLGLERKNEAADRVRDFRRGWVTSKTRPPYWGADFHASTQAESV